MKPVHRHVDHRPAEVRHRLSYLARKRRLTGGDDPVDRDAEAEADQYKPSPESLTEPVDTFALRRDMFDPRQSGLHELVEPVPHAILIRPIAAKLLGTRCPRAQILGLNRP
jgi:hypothetical protein